MIVSFDSLKFKEWNAFDLVKAKSPLTYLGKMPNEACFFYVLKGESKITTQQTEFKAEEKDSVLLNCGNYISDLISENGEHEILFIHFYPEMIKEIFKDGIGANIEPDQKKTLISTKISKLQIVEKFAESVLFYFKNPELVDEEIIKLKIRELILILLKIEDNGNIKTILSSLFDPIKLSFKDIIEEHIYTDISIDKLCFLTGRSLASFKRDFKKYYANSPSQYIKTRKLEKASKLLVESKLRINEIIYECGMNNASHFTKVFSEKFNQSPTNYRKSHSTNKLS